jgi:hypothetical protein
VASLKSQLQQVQEKNAELTAQLGIRERINGALIHQLEKSNRELEEKQTQLEQQLRQAQEENRDYRCVST